MRHVVHKLQGFTFSTFILLQWCTPVFTKLEQVCSDYHELAPDLHNFSLICTSLHNIAPVCIVSHLCAPVCTSFHLFVTVYTCLQKLQPVYISLHKFAQVCIGLNNFQQFCTSLKNFAPANSLQKLENVNLHKCSFMWSPINLGYKSKLWHKL